MGFLDWLLRKPSPQVPEIHEPPVIDNTDSGFPGLLKWASEKAKKEVREAASKHLSVLSRKRLQLCTQDDYGRDDDTLWVKDLDHFITNIAKVNAQKVVSMAGPSYRLTEETRNLQIALRWVVNKALNDFEEGNQRASDASAPMTGLTGVQFEHRCADRLRQLGWQVRDRGRPGDQGTDLLIVKNGVTISIQCKHTGGPIGNKAVQEAIAGRVFAGAQQAAVVTSSSYTRSARQLAASASVLLLHFDELGSL